MSEGELFLKIVDTLEEHGPSCDEYQLHRWVDVEALGRLVDSTNADLEIRISVDEFCLLVTHSGVQVLSNSSEESNCRDWDEGDC